MSGSADAATAPLTWFGVIRLGLVQAALGAVVVLVISTLNRVMVVEYALPAILPGMLVALHYGVQMIRPRFGYGSDRGGRRTPWIVGGMGVLAVGGLLCAVAAVELSHGLLSALALAIVAYVLVGLGVGAAGTSLLVLLAARVDGRRHAAAATIMWVLMVAGFATTSAIVGHFLDPFSPRRLLIVSGIAALSAFLIAVAAVWNVEGSVNEVLTGARSSGGAGQAHGEVSFSEALRRIWSEPRTRRFTLFVFVSMLAYSAQELLLEPFAGLVFGYTLGASAKLSGLWHGSAVGGMIFVGVACSGRLRCGSLRGWTIGGCCASAAALVSLACGDLVGPSWPMRISVVVLGVSNGMFAVAAIGSMMQLAREGGTGSAGVRMGLWGAAQAVAFALGGLLASSIVDSTRFLFGSPNVAFAIVFSAEALLFFLAAWFAAHVASLPAKGSPIGHSTAVTV